MKGGWAARRRASRCSPNYTVTLYNYNPVTQTVVGRRRRAAPAIGWCFSSTRATPSRPTIIGSTSPTSSSQLATDTRIFDIYGNQLDGENLGNQTEPARCPDFPTLPNYEDLQSDGTNRQNDMSGDGVAGGAFMAGFTVVNYGNVVFARPDYVENPLVPSTLSNGSLANPYPVWRPRATRPRRTRRQLRATNPNGGLNSTFFYQPGNFNHGFRFQRRRQFEQSALYAASQLTFVVGVLGRAVRSSSSPCRAFPSATRSPA